MIGFRRFVVGRVVVAMLGFILEMGKNNSSVPWLQLQHELFDGSIIYSSINRVILQTACSVCKGYTRSYVDNALWIEFEGKGAGFRIYGASQGTLLAGNRLLTHHHYDPALESLESLALTLTDAKGNQTHVMVDPNRIIVFDASTAIIPLPEDFSVGNGFPTLNTTEVSLQAGEMVTVIYLSDTHQLVQTQFPVVMYTVEPNGGLTSLILEDQQLVIEPGDSGGGVYYHGMLIGNLWAIGPTPTGSQYVRVGLVPDEVMP